MAETKTSAAVVSPAFVKRKLPVRSVHEIRQQYLRKLNRLIPDGSLLFELDIRANSRPRSFSDSSRLRRASTGTKIINTQNYKQSTDGKFTGSRSVSFTDLAGLSGDTPTSPSRKIKLNDVSAQSISQPNKDSSSPLRDTGGSSRPRSASLRTNSANITSTTSPPLGPMLAPRSSDRLRRGLMQRLQAMSNAPVKPTISAETSPTNTASPSPNDSPRLQASSESASQLSSSEMAGYHADSDSISPHLLPSGQPTTNTIANLSLNMEPPAVYKNGPNIPLASVAARRARSRAKRAFQRERNLALKQHLSRTRPVQGATNVSDMKQENEKVSKTQSPREGQLRNSQTTPVSVTCNDSSAVSSQSSLLTKSTLSETETATSNEATTRIGVETTTYTSKESTVRSTTSPTKKNTPQQSTVQPKIPSDMTAWGPSELDLLSRPLHLINRNSILWWSTRRVKQCHSCSEAFSFLIRKHHCRLCGLVMCAACAPRSVVIITSSQPYPEAIRVIYPPEKRNSAESPKQFGGNDETTARVCHFCRALSFGSILPMPRLMYFLNLRAYNLKLGRKPDDPVDLKASSEKSVTYPGKYKQLWPPNVRTHATPPFVTGQPPPGSATVLPERHDTLMWLDSIARGDLTEVELRAALGQLVDAQERSAGRFGLYVAAEYGHVDIAKELLRTHHASPTMTTFSGRTALHAAALQGDRSMVRILIHYGVPQAHVDCNGDTAIMLAKRHGHDALLQVMDNNLLFVDESMPPTKTKTLRATQEEISSMIQPRPLKESMKCAKFDKLQAQLTGRMPLQPISPTSKENNEERYSESSDNTSRRATALPIPAKSQLLEAGLGVLDAAAQALQANLLAVRNAAVTYAQGTMWQYDIGSLSFHSILHELGFTTSIQRFVLPSIGCSAASAIPATRAIANVWKIGHMFGSDVDVSDLIREIAESQANSAFERKAMDPVHFDVMSTTSTSESAISERNLMIDVPLPLAQSVDDALEAQNADANRNESLFSDPGETDDDLELISDMDDDDDDDDDDDEEEEDELTDRECNRNETA